MSTNIVKHFVVLDGDQTCMIPFGHSVQHQYVVSPNKHLIMFGCQTFSLWTGLYINMKYYKKKQIKEPCFILLTVGCFSGVFYFSHHFLVSFMNKQAKLYFVK